MGERQSRDDANWNDELILVVLLLADHHLRYAFVLFSLDYITQ